jgi:hypothetical protein
MPTLAQGSNVTLTLASSDIVTIVAHGGEYKIELPAGTVVAVAGDTRSFGPYVGGGSFKITANQAPLSYEQATVLASPSSFLLSPSAPVDADGRPDGTIWIQTA